MNDVTLSDLEAALDMMHDIEDRVVRARAEGRRARISITEAQWSTLRDTLISAVQNLGTPLPALIALVEVLS